MVCGVLLVFLTGFVIKETTIADHVVAPLLLPDTSGTADVIVALGAGVIGDCAANQNALRRVLLSVRLLREGRGPMILFTGGSGNADCAVAEVMAGLAREMGVPASNIRMETASYNTHENAERSAPILRAVGARRLLLVTDRLHMRRAESAFKHLGFEVERAAVPIYEGHADNVSMLTAGLREIAALAYYRLRGWNGAARAASPVASGPPQTGKTMPPVKHPTGPIVVLGASYAAGWDPNTVAGVPLINVGVGGQQSFEMLARFERDVVRAAPRAVILWGFINDLFRADPQQIDGALARVRDSYTQMVKLARLHGIEPIIATEVTVRPQDFTWIGAFRTWLGAVRGKQSYQDGINKHVLEGNRWLTDMARREGLRLLDFQATLAEPSTQRRRREFTREDGSHITPAGYKALTAYANAVLEGQVGQQRGS